LVHELAAPNRPGPAETISEPAAVNGLAMVTIVADVHGTPAEMTFPELLNCAQSPALNVPPPNHRLAPRSVQVLAAVQPYKLCPAGAAVLKNVAPVEQVTGSAAPVWKGLVEVADEKSILLVCVRKSTRVWADNIGRQPSNTNGSRQQFDFMVGTVLWALALPATHIHPGNFPAVVGASGQPHFYQAHRKESPRAST
jgi:hypothetical protein